MTVPAIFLSAASDDLKEWRDLLHRAFERAGCKVYTQGQSLAASAGDVPHLLRQHLDKSQYVIHLAGVAYGAEPDHPPFPDAPDFRCSYTQFEYYYAHRRGKQVIAFVCAPDFPYLPFTEKGADDADRERRRRLQLAHRERVSTGRFTGTPLDGHPQRPLSEPIADVRALLTAVAAAVGTIRDASPGSAAGRAMATAKDELEREAHAVIPVDFTGTSFPDLRARFCDLMVRKLDSYDREMNWSDRDLTPLEAEVEMESRGAAKPRIVGNLTAAIRRDTRSNAFLVIGDPGSGKSVSLRRLARELYATAARTGKVPLYVNLREWDGQTEPTDADIHDFIKRSVAQFAGRYGQEFVARHFHDMVKRGEWFFILDSFDELPSVLDCPDGSARLRAVSRAFDRFCNDLHGCRAVLASRPFRRPVGFRGRRLTIRPFRESQVRAAMKVWLKGMPLDPATVVRRLFKDRPELAPAIRNPFTADLIAKYIVQTGGDLPKSYVDIFDAHLERTLVPWERAHGAELGLPAAAIQDSAATIALRMFKEAAGFEIELNQLHNLLRDPDLRSKVEAMREVRLIRLGGASAERFSFVHRRFAEFFAVRGMLKDQGPVEYHSIPEDSRWRDALVVYCSVAPEQTAREIANYCWTMVQSHIGGLCHETIEGAKPGIHLLRFLKDAFRSRPECLSEFQVPLTDTVLDGLRSDELIANWISAECIPLIEHEKQPDAITLAFDKKSSWIADTALRACRHLSSLGRQADDAIRGYVKSLSTGEFLNLYHDLRFSFSLSDSFRKQRLKLLFDMVSLVLLWVSVPLWLVIGLLLINRRGTHYTGVFYLLSSTFALLMELIDRVMGGRFVQTVPHWLTGSRQPLCSALRFGTMIGMLSWYMNLAIGLETDLLYYALPVAWLPIIVPWDQWQIIARKLVETKPSAIVLLSLIMTAGALIPFLIMKGVEKLSDSGGVAATAILIYGISIIVAINYSNWHWIRHALGTVARVLHDWKTLAYLTTPEKTTREWIVRYCAALRTEWGRVRFLTSLRFRQVPISGPPVTLPKEDWVTTPVREAYTRLELQWQEIAEE